MRFSVIIPLYNKALYVANAIESVLSQTITDFELVIMDDGSRDNSFDVAQEAIKGHDNCYLFQQENAGVSMARNNAVATSKGEYLCFLDADDWWSPTFLEEMSHLIENFPDAGIYGTSYIIVNEAKHKTHVAPVGVGQGFEKGYINYCQVYAKTLAMPLWTGAVCIPRPVFDEMHGFPKDIKLGEDFMLWIKIALKYKVFFLNKPLAFYNQDVDAANRGVGRLHQPKCHMLWNLDFLADEEKSNPDYKQLVDNLRSYALYPYFLSRKYHEFARLELDKVDWSKQPKKTREKYKRPLAWLRIEYNLRQFASMLKTRSCRY
ncbi:MAG: glycosyltransferase [Bacteroidales bacterium]|nr:glycosyltransferase [Bacteroidales bacterium]